MIYPRIAALLPLLFALVSLWAFRRTVKAKRGTTFSRLFPLFCYGISVVASLAFAYHILMGHPIKSGQEHEMPAPKAGQRNAQRASIPIIPSPLDSKQAIENPTPSDGPPNPKRFMIFWNDGPGIDGDFVLVIHPTQIFLRSMHNNPNPNAVYWLHPLSPSQYARIKTFLQSYRGSVFAQTQGEYTGYQLYDLTHSQVSPWFPANFTAANVQEAWNRKHQAAIISNLRRILRELNRGLLHTDSKLPEEASQIDLSHMIGIKE